MKTRITTIIPTFSPTIVRNCKKRKEQESRKIRKMTPFDEKHPHRIHGPPPPHSVLTAFGITSLPRPIQGGQYTSYIAGDFVLKPAEDLAVDSYTIPLLASLPPSSHFTIPKPFPVVTSEGSDDSVGRYIIDGWTCTEYLPGMQTIDAATFPMTLIIYKKILATSRAFHKVLAGAVAHEPFVLAQSITRWAVAMRVAFEEVECPPRSSEVMAMWARLRELLVRVQALRRNNIEDSGEVNLDDEVRQLVHGDLAGNVMFPVLAESERDNYSDLLSNDSQSPKPASSSTLPPAIIDFSPYWRSVAVAEAVLVADGLLWYGAAEDVLMEATTTISRSELLIRALMFRVISDPLDDGQWEIEGPNFRRVVFMVEKRVRDMEVKYLVEVDHST